MSMKHTILLFLIIHVFFYKCCHMKEVNVNTIRHEPKKPWLTSSLVNACHKNKLYRLFLKHNLKTEMTTACVFHQLMKKKFVKLLKATKKLI